MLKISDFFDLNDFEHRKIFSDCENIWDVLAKIGEYIDEFSETHEKYSEIPKDFYLDENNYIFIGRNTKIEPGAYIKGPCIIGNDCEIRTGAYIRENVIIGSNTVIGHASETKNTVILNNSALPHYNYVGDSLIGNNVNLGAGCILSNVPLYSKKDPVTGRRDTVKIKIGEKIIDTGLSKFGAVIGDGTKTGCNSVLNPGCILGRECSVYPNISVKKFCYGSKKTIK